jgi:glutamyl-tRNA synthetase
MGGVRTALYNYLYAKQHGGDFIIRIEDTDSRRFVPGAEKYIIEALDWCGIKADEGIDEEGNVVEKPSPRHPHAPYRQSQRKEIYRKYAEELVGKGAAYYAFDTPEELEEARKDSESAGNTFIYNRETRGKLRNSLTLDKSECDLLLKTRNDWTVRFMMPENAIVEMDDLVRGHMEVNTDTLDDKVLWKRADELPTYHLANIVDDHLMEITEVIRGEEWLPSLPLHYLLYKAFGWEGTMPHFAHLPLLLKPDGKGKLSKRDGDRLGFPVFPLKWTNSEGDVSRGYREDGYFPEAFVNMLAMLGWNPGDDRELFTIDELVDVFSLDRVVKSGARFNPEKAKWYNKEYLRKKSDEELAELLIPVLESHGMQIVDCPVCAITAGAEFTVNGADFKNHIYTREYVTGIIKITRDRAVFVKDFWDIASYLFVSPEEFGEYGIKAGESTAKAENTNDPRRKVYDDSKTAPFPAKDVEKFWKPENYMPVSKCAGFIDGFDGGLMQDFPGEALEDFIRGNGWPMGKVMNCLRMALAGTASGLGIADIITSIGKKEVGRRIDYIYSRLGR